MAVEIYTLRAAADLLRTTERALRARARRGAISSQKIGGRWVVAFDPADLPELRREHATK